MTQAREVLPRDSRTRRLADAVRRANAPPPPEDSVALRLATAIAVLAGVAACEHVGELSTTAAILSMLAIGAGMAFSYATRHRPWRPLKLLLAIAVLGVFAQFVLGISSAARIGDLASVEGPLAGLFVWVQVIHSLDVPARRDLLFSLAASGALLAVAGAEAVDTGFAAFVAVWAVAVVAGLSLSWRSILGGGGRMPVGTVVASLVIVTLGAGLVVAALPAPQAAQTLTLPASISSFVALSDPGALVGGPNGTEPAKAGAPGGATGVGGYLGFSEPLDTAVRSSLGNQVVFHVRATIPGYLLGATYDHWDGQSWTSSPAFRGTRTISGGAPFSIPQSPNSVSGGPVDVQTFYIATPLPNLIFSAGQPEQVWFPDRELYLGGDGSIRTAAAMTTGTVYTVVADDDQLTPAELARDRAPLVVPPSLRPYLQLPHSYPRVAALTRSVTAGHSGILAKVQALEAWMAAHVRYSTDIPPLLPGQDAVDQFLFGSRVGYCEQISTALTVMLRTIGIPAREAIGYVPGPYNPLTNLYEVQAKDAHAWVQVWFPGIGWQSFDPTADVPLAPADPGAALARDTWHAVAGLPWPFLLPVAAVFSSEEALRRRWRRRPRSWQARAARPIERAGARAGVERRRAETLGEFAGRLGVASPEVGAAVAALERAAYAPPDALLEDRTQVVRAARAGAAALRHGHRTRWRRPRAQAPGSASASSKDAPSATSPR